ncbi:hypothetical protein BIT28_20230 [Photobacterium proteolyticum]|uniref:Glycine transporter domain-containing protein n=2 Tax=Photobacterium proteolyticum TaxID=1903952 RepID=A0A1Q9G5Q3_9GAMM|nr:hypothetical protein BIT28_20230 [Photobacterium proteolyticum]
MDAFGAVVLGGLTAIGGGTIRDMAIGATPVFWMNDSTYLWVILATCITTIIAIRNQRNIPNWLLSISDAIGLAVFVGIGFEKAMQYQNLYTVATIIGVITGCGGGIVRDSLTGEIPSIFKREIYATSCFIGGIVYASSLKLGLTNATSFFLCVSCTLIARLISMNYSLSLPTVHMIEFSPTKSEKKDGIYNGYHEKV